jgi:hypothetical protein
VTNDEPNFEVSHLHGDADGESNKSVENNNKKNLQGNVKIFVFAQNAKGSSEPFIIEETLRQLRHSKHAVEGNESNEYCTRICEKTCVQIDASDLHTRSFPRTLCERMALVSLRAFANSSLFYT